MQEPHLLFSVMILRPHFYLVLLDAKAVRSAAGRLLLVLLMLMSRRRLRSSVLEEI
jgi:hypothetical protein